MLATALAAVLTNLSATLLLWRRTLTRQGIKVSSWECHRVALTLTPVSLVAGAGVPAEVA